MGKILRRVYYLLNRRRLEKELEDELAAHRERMDASRRHAFGNNLQIREQTRDAWGWRWLDDLQHDLHHGARGFVRDRRVAVFAVLAIALAVGAATAVFSVVDRSLFRPLPYEQGNRLVTVGLVLPSWGPRDTMFAGAFHDWQATQSALDLTHWTGVSACDLGGDSPLRVNCGKAAATFLPVLGIQPFLGRNFTAEEDAQGGEPVAILSFALWRNQFGSDVGAIDKRITLDGQSTRIIGVLPPQFETPDLEPIDLLAPRKLARERTRNVEIKVIGRLRPQQTLESARSSLEPLFQSFRADFGARAGDNFAKTMRLRLAKLRDEQLQEYRIALWILLGAVTAFVLIACANVGNLLLARSIARRQEFGIRTALGASRERLVRQMLTESGLLGLIGGAAGCALAWGLLRLAIAVAPEGVLRLSQATLDARVLAFALALSLGAAFLFGLGPSLHRLSVEVLSGTRVIGRRRHWVGPGLIVGQISAAVVLLTAAGLLLLSLWRLQNTPLGFERERVITASFTLPQYRYTRDTQQIEFFTRLEERLQALPGSIAAAITDTLPPGEETRRAPVANKTGSEIIGSIRWRYVSPGYFEALGIPIKLGRSFIDADRNAGDLAVVISERLWRSEYGETSPIGARTGKSWPRVVVGVVGDVRNNGVGKTPDAEFYVVRRNSREGIPGDPDPAWWRRATAVVRTTLNPQAASALLRSTIHELDPALPTQIRSMDREVDRYLVRPRFQTVLMGVFAFTGMILAGIGLYGLISFLVAARSHEIGVRRALGATSAGIVRMVVADAARWTAAGLLIGTVAATLSTRLLQTLLYEIGSLDIRAFLGAIALLAFISFLAAWIPALRAATVEPAETLRHR